MSDRLLLKSFCKFQSLILPFDSMQQASADTVLTPRFYTTDFDQMEEMFNLEKNPSLPMG